MPAFTTESLRQRGTTFEDYLARFIEAEARFRGTGGAGLDERALARAHNLALNLQRTRRILRSFAPGESIRAALAALATPQLWIVLTEHWCGDCAQLLPCLVRIAQLNALIELRILERDANSDVMDAYLTDGTRSIPKLVAFDAQGTELFRWGPRPRPAVELFRRERERGLPREEVLRVLHRWYGEDRGRTLERELLACLSDHGGQG
jgi:hypothetical protein